jgi:mannose-6-phosphate isomerase
LQFFKNTEDKNFASLKNTLKKDQDGRLSVEEGLKTFFKSLMEADENLKKELIRTMITSARKNNNPDPALEWMMRIQAIEKFKNDIGVFAPLFLNLVVLNPGEALFLPPGRLHAYLEGTAIEIMANSDNTLRGGLTQKHIDLTELLKVVRFEETKIGIINPPKNLECIYKTPAREFMLSRIHIDQERPYYRTDRKSIEIALCTEGTVVISCTDNHQPLTIKKGDSVLIPAVVDSYRMTGSAVIYKAGVGR